MKDTAAGQGPLERLVRPGFDEWCGGMYRGLQLAIAQAAWDAATERAARVAEQQAECNGLAAGWHIAAEIRGA